MKTQQRLRQWAELYLQWHRFRQRRSDKPSLSWPSQTVHAPSWPPAKPMFTFIRTLNGCYPLPGVSPPLLTLTSPTYFCTSSEPMTLMKQASVLFATARAHRVFPVPGGPNSSTPFGGSIPKLTNLSGWRAEDREEQEDQSGWRHV